MSSEKPFALQFAHLNQTFLTPTIQAVLNIKVNSSTKEPDYLNSTVIFTAIINNTYEQYKINLLETQLESINFEVYMRLG